MALKNRFPGNPSPGPNGPFTDAEAVTPADPGAEPTYYRGLFVGGTGNLKVTMRDGGVVTIPSVPANTWLNIWVRAVWSNGTTATNIIGFM